MIKEYLGIKKSYFYIAVSVMMLAIMLLQRDELYNVVLMNTEQTAIKNLQSLFDKTLWIAIPLVPLAILIRVTYTATCISLGRFFSLKSHAMQFEPYFNIALKAEVIWMA